MESGKGNLVKGYIVICVSCIMYIAVVALIQTIGNRTSVFVLNCFRFALETVLAVVAVIAFRYSVHVAKEDIPKFVMACSMNYGFITAFYTASYVLPAGTLDGVQGGLFILIATVVDAVKRQISKLSYVTSGFAVLGILLLTQPWHVDLLTPATTLLPCEYLEGRHMTHDQNYTVITSNHTVPMESTTTPSRLYLLLGYFYVLIASACNVGAGNFFRDILQDYTIYCLLFWSGIYQLSISVIITVALKLGGSPHISLPNAGPCLWLTFAFILSGLIAKVSTNIASKYVPVSKIALSTTVTTVILYVLQRTVLHAFRPGHANVLEIIGIVLVFLAAILSPIITILFEAKLLQYKSTDEDETTKMIN